MDTDFNKILYNITKIVAFINKNKHEQWQGWDNER